MLSCPHRLGQDGIGRVAILIPAGPSLPTARVLGGCDRLPVGGLAERPPSEQASKLLATAGPRGIEHCTAPRTEVKRLVDAASLEPGATAGTVEVLRGDAPGRAARLRLVKDRFKRRASSRNAEPAVPAATIQGTAEVDPNRSQDVTPRPWLPIDESRLEMMRRVKQMTIEERLALFQRLSRRVTWARSAKRVR